MEKITLKVELDVKDLNRVLALTGQDLLLDEESIECYNNLTLNVSDLDDKDVSIGVSGLIIAAKANKQ